MMQLKWKAMNIPTTVNKIENFIVVLENQIIDSKSRGNTWRCNKQ